MSSGEDDEQDDMELELANSDRDRFGEQDEELDMSIGSSSSLSGHPSSGAEAEEEPEDEDDDTLDHRENEGTADNERDRDGGDGLRSRSASMEEETHSVHDSQSQPILSNSKVSAARRDPASSKSRTASVDLQVPSNHSTIVPDSSTTLDLTPARLFSYKDRVERRKRIVAAHRTFSKPPLIDPLLFIPHGAPIHALALPPCGSHVFSGGQDGFIRRIAIYESVTGSTAENLTMRQGGHVPLIEKEGDKTTVFLTGYWENEDSEASVQPLLKAASDSSSARTSGRWGPKSVGNAVKVSPVYSLAVHNEELWGLSGTESGNINLFTIRHDEGHIRHVFKAADLPPGPLSHSSPVQGHKTGSVVSCLDLNHHQDVAFSGGWDGNVLGWDLNTGQIIHKFIAHASQISSVTLRPEGSFSIYDSKREDSVLETSPRVEEPVHPSEQLNEPRWAQLPPVLPDKPPSPATAASSPEKPLAEEVGEDTEDDSLFGGAGNSGTDTDSTDESPLGVLAPPNSQLSLPSRSELSLPRTGNLPNQQSSGFSQLQLPNAPSISKTALQPLPPPPVLRPTHLTQVPSVSDSSLPFLNNDILMTSGIDGQVYLWDRRIEPSEEKGLVRKLDLPKGTSPWTSSATWSTDGLEVYVGRRNHSVDLYDLRYISSCKPSRVQRTIRLPASSGPVSCVKSWPDGKGVLCASFDNIRLWNLQAESDGVKIPFKIIPGHSTGVVSQMCVTPSQRFLITASGDRGWENLSNEFLVVHEIRAV